MKDRLRSLYGPHVACSCCSGKLDEARKGCCNESLQNLGGVAPLCFLQRRLDYSGASHARLAFHAVEDDEPLLVVIQWHTPEYCAWTIGVLEVLTWHMELDRVFLGWTSLGLISQRQMSIVAVALWLKRIC